MSVMVDIRSVHRGFGPLEVLKDVALSVRTDEVTVVFMDDGRIVEQGPPAEVPGRPEQERTRLFLSEVL